MKFFTRSSCKKPKSNYKYYKSIDFLILYCFFKVIETEDVRYLLKLDDYEILPEVDLTELNEAWINIQTQYAEAENSNSSVIQFITAKSLHKMETEYLMLWDIYNLLSIAPEAAKEVIKKAGLEGKGLEWIEKRIKALINRIKIKRKDIEYDTPTKKPNFLLIID